MSDGNPQGHNKFLIEEEDQSNIDDNELSSNNNPNQNKKESNVENEIYKSQIFGLNVNEAMAKKTFTPSIILIISIESNPNQEDTFWHNKSVLNILTPDFIIVRLSQTHNVIEILQFSSIFSLNAVPSLFVFGPFSQGVSHVWSGKYPAPSEFIQYVQQQLLNKNQASSESIPDLISQPSYQNPPTINQSYSIPSSPTSSFPISANATSFVPYSTRSDRLTNISQHEANMESTIDTTISSSSDTNANNNNNNNYISSNENSINNNNSISLNGCIQSTSALKKSSSSLRKSTARISVQLKGQPTIFEFSPDSRVEDVVNKIESKFGRSYELYVPHLRRCLNFTPNELQQSIRAADLSPSATIILRGPNDPSYSSNIRSNSGFDDSYLEANNNELNENNHHEPYIPPPSTADRQFISNVGDDAQPSLNIDENLPVLGHTDTREVVPSDNINNDPENNTANPHRTDEQPNENRCGWNLFKKILSIVNPFGDIEEVEDFFETKEFIT